MVMVEQVGLLGRRKSSNDRKRSYSDAEARDVESKRRTVEISTGYVGGFSPSYPVSSLYHSHRDSEVTNGSQRSQKSKIADFTEGGYPGQCDHFRDYPLTQPQDPGSSYRPLPAKLNNRFNLSRYQLDAEDELTPNPVMDCGEKPNRFKSQRERLMLAAEGEEEEEEEEKEEEESQSLSSGSRSESQDSYMSQRERLRRFSSEHSRHVVIPNEWEGEQQLQEFVALGNIEAALRPLGLMMARAALVSDSVTTQHRRPSSTARSCCQTIHGNPRSS